MTEANTGNGVPLTKDQKLALVSSALSTIKRFAPDLVADQPEGNAFDDVSFSPATGEMTDASDSATVKQAINSLKTATAEINTVETITQLVTFIGEEVGIVV